MRRLVRKAFGIYTGEGRNTFRFGLLGITWAFAACTANTLAMSFLLERCGIGFLPLVYLIIASGMIGVSSLLIYFLRKTSSHRIFLWTTAIASSIFSLATLVLSHHPENWVWTFLFIFSYIVESALIACYWTFVDQYHDLQEAKRLYGIYSAAIFLGYVVSGLFINQLINVLGVVPFFAATAVSLFFCMGQIRKIVRKCSPVEDDALDEVFSSGKRGLLTLLQNFCKSPYALILVGMSIVAQLLRTCTEINFMETFSKVFDPSHSSVHLPRAENLIAEFIGKLKAFIYFGNIIFAMFFYRNCVRRFQLPNMLLIPPIFFLAVFGDWLIYDALFVAVLGVIAVDFFLFTIEDNNFNLLVNAGPSKLKGVLRIINDSFFEPIGMLLSSGFLLLVQTNSKWFGFALAIAFLVFSFFMKNIYSLSMLSHLKQNAIRFEKRIRDWMNLWNVKEKKDLKKDLLKALNCENEEDKLLAFKALISFQDPTFLEDLLFHADTLSVSGKIAWIHLMDESSFSQDPKILEKIDSWTETSSELLIKTASLFLAKRGLLHPEKVIQHLDGQDLYERTAAIITLKKSLANQSAAKAGLHRTIASKERDLLLKSEDLDEIAMGLEVLSVESGREVMEKALYFLNHESLRIKRSAAKCVEKLADKTQSRCASMILDALQSSNDTIFRISCLEALGKIGDSTTVSDIILSTTYFRPNERRVVESIITGMGLKTVPVLLSIIKNASIHNRCRILAAKILGSIALPQLQANLMDIINAEIERAYFYFLYGHTIPKQYPLYDLSLLQNTLLSGYQSVIDFIVYLLGIASSIEACDFLAHALHGKNAKARANAIETIEKNCDFKIFREIAPLLDDVPWESKIESFSELKSKFPKLSLTKLLDRLENSPSLFDRTVSAHLKAQMQIPNWKQSLREQIKTSDELFHHFAYELLDT